jgi:hypothetical protein
VLTGGVAASAQATTVRLGPPTLASTGDAELQCASECYGGAQISAPGLQTKAPGAGRITAWRVQGALSASGTIKLVVLDISRPNATARKISAEATNVTGGANAVNLPIDNGEFIGVTLCRCSGGSTTVVGQSDPNADLFWWFGAFTAEGQTLSEFTPRTFVVQMNADIVLAPAVSGVSPGLGPTAGGTQVTISGQYLDGATQVLFGSTPAQSFTVDSPSQIRATAPGGTDGSTVDVTVIGPGGTSATSNSSRYTFKNPPVINALSPSSGPALGGTEVTITGSGFDGVGAVNFGGNASTLYVVDSPTRIRASAPAGPAGQAVDVQVIAAGGTSQATAASRFTYNASTLQAGLDVKAPVLTAYAITPSAFVAANAGPTIAKVAVGGRVKYKLSETATTTFGVKRKTRGVRKGKRCVRAPKPPAKKQKPCDLLTAVKGSFAHKGAAGPNAFRFMGRVRGNALSPGNYVLTASSKDAAGNKSKLASRPFRILKP